ENASWDSWQADLCESATWLARRGTPVRILWGLRLGALLATSIVGRLDPQPDLLLWQPVLSGKSHMTQFLRLKAAEQMLNPAGERGATSKLRSELAAGKNVDVAGYTLNPTLVAAIDAAELELPSDYRGRIVWLETGRTDQAELTPVSAQRIA